MKSDSGQTHRLSSHRFVLTFILQLVHRISARWLYNFFMLKAMFVIGLKTCPCTFIWGTFFNENVQSAYTEWGYYQSWKIIYLILNTPCHRLKWRQHNRQRTSSLKKLSNFVMYLPGAVTFYILYMNRTNVLSWLLTITPAIPMVHTHRQQWHLL